MGDELVAELVDLIDEADRQMDELLTDVPVSWDQMHAWWTQFAEASGEWAGIPMPVDGYHLTLEPSHPMNRATEAIFDLTPAAKARRAERREALGRLDPSPRAEYRISCSGTDVDDTEYVRNSWWSERKQRYVYLVQKGGRVVLQYSRKVRPVTRFNLQIDTIGASGGWNLDAEREAMVKLRSLITPHLADMYELTGAFMETSKRSGLTYLFRRLRPTVVMAPVDRHDDNAPMKILNVLCLHPLGYYQGTWAGAMVPTDDVIAHLMMMRGDEHLFWKRANHHLLHEPEAGL